VSPIPVEFTLALGTSLQPTTISASSAIVTWSLLFRYDEICTNFNHDGTSVNFTGNARLSGVAIRTGTNSSPFFFTTETIGPAADLVMGILSASFVPDLTTTVGFLLSESSMPQSLYSAYTPNYTSLQGTVGCIGVFVSPDDVSGTIFGEIFGNGVDRLGSDGFLPFTLTRGGLCSV
jgi:hypothetical protein